MPDETPSSPPVDQAALTSQTLDPPTNLGGILRQLGPGLIIAGSIVGSGELIATTAVGAEAGFVLLWLIIIGCVIKVFVQIEFGKYAITHGKTTLDGMNEVPGPRFGGNRASRINWVCWFWLIFIVVALAQLGGIIGGVGQAVSLQVPVTEQGERVNDYQALDTRLDVIEGMESQLVDEPINSERRVELLTERASTIRQLDELVGLDPERQEVLVEYAFESQLAGLDIEGASSRDFLPEGRGRVDELEQEIEQKWSDPPLTDQQAAHVESVALRELIQLAERFGDSETVAALEKERGGLAELKKSNDPLIWATVITLGSIVILVLGRYRLIQNVSTALVAMFTFVTIANLVMLQSMPDWHLTWEELLSGMTFKVPPGTGLATALAAFGIIGVGATELIQYPYWCLEKGYAKWTGPRDQSDQWAKRAEGWLRVLKWDAWCSMVVYTFATIAFYLLGAAILGRAGLNPEGTNLVRTLGEMYVPVFGDWAQGVFLFGAFAVLYSTFFVATASHARVLSDALRVFGVSAGGDKAYQFWTKIFSGTLPLLFLGSFAFISNNPKQLVLAGGFMGALMLPLLGVTALYGRYRRTDERMLPTKLWDVFLWVSVLGLFIAGGWALYVNYEKLLAFVTGGG